MNIGLLMVFAGLLAAGQSTPKMKSILQTFLKSPLVGATFVIAGLVGGMIVTLFGFHLPEAENPAESLMWFFAGGIIAGLCLGPIASSIPASRRRHFFVWGSLIFLNIASVVIEGYFFAPELIGDALPALLLQQLVAALAAGLVITVLFVSKESAAPVTPVNRSILSWIWRFAAGTLAYVLFYFIFGSINYMLVTKTYYETHAGWLDVPPAEVTNTAEFVRGALIALSVIPFLLTVPAGKKRLGALTGFIFFAIGGLVPLTMQVGALPRSLRYNGGYPQLHARPGDHPGHRTPDRFHEGARRQNRCPHSGSIPAALRSKAYRRRAGNPGPPGQAAQAPARSVCTWSATYPEARCHRHRPGHLVTPDGQRPGGNGLRQNDHRPGGYRAVGCVSGCCNLPASFGAKMDPRG